MEQLDLGDSKVRGMLKKLYTERFGLKALNELERAVKQGEIKSRATQEETGSKKKKREGFCSAIDKCVHNVISTDRPERLMQLLSGTEAMKTSQD